MEELQYALEVMGIKKTVDEVKELMDSVDGDGSGACGLLHGSVVSCGVVWQRVVVHGILHMPHTTQKHFGCSMLAYRYSAAFPYCSTCLTVLLMHLYHRRA